MDLSGHMHGVHAVPKVHMPSAPMIPPTSYIPVPKGYTVQDLQLAGGCDWYKLERLVHAESRLIALLKKEGLVDPAMKLEQMRDNVLAHRMAISPSTDIKQFLRNNCANDSYISKWRDDIDKFANEVGKLAVKAKVPAASAMDIEYYAKLLKQQARASLPYTGYANDNYKVPRMKPVIAKELKYEPRFTVSAIGPPALSGFL